ncbi:MAG: glycosyltransferase 87 family protein [Acidobacteriota bacterium]
MTRLKRIACRGIALDRLIKLAALLLLVIGLAWNGLAAWRFLPRSGGDFAHFHAAARSVLEAHSPYAAGPGRASLDYPPLVPLFMAPLGALDLGAAREAWLVLSLACLAAAALCTWRWLGGSASAALAVAGTWTLAGTVQENLGLGQMNPLILLLLAAALLLAERRPGVAAALVGVGAALKVWPGLLLAGWLGRVRALAVGVVAAAAGLVVAGLLLGALTPPPHLPQSAGYWMGSPAFLNASVAAVAVRFTYPLSIEAAPRVLAEWQSATDAGYALDGRRAKVSLGVALATLCLGLLALGRASFWSNPEGRQWAIPSLVALALLASPISWYHYQICQLPALAGLAWSAWQRRRAGTLLGLALLTVLLTRGQVLGALAQRTALSPASMLLLPGLTIAGANLVLMILLLRRVRAASGEGDRVALP